MDTWRLNALETQNGFINMAVDEAILTSRIENLVPDTLRFYQWKPSAISIGRNQNPKLQVYKGALHKYGVDLVRRMSGGGTVYHDQNGELTYSVTAKSRNLGKDVTAIYASIYGAVNDALRLLGIPADYSPGNVKNCPNLTVKGKKISGSAQTLGQGVVQQHGTLLLKVNLLLMFQLLRVPFTADCSSAAQIARDKITSLQGELGHAVSAETVQNAMVQGFKSILKINIRNGTLTRYEKALAMKLCREKYSCDSWNSSGKISQSSDAT
jgi:lipoate-protein ligase A